MRPLLAGTLQGICAGHRFHGGPQSLRLSGVARRVRPFRLGANHAVA